MNKSTASICIATYNGENFIGEQLYSILSQISIGDEVIVVDDGSKDRTIEIINAIGDSRIRLFSLQKNGGHVRAFEEALTHANNEIIFLSDQDDIWLPGKYQRVLKEFDMENSPVLVVHGLSVIDANGNFISNNWFSLSSGYWSGLTLLVRELIKPRVFGSASAFRRSLFDVMLPFPKFVYAHDHWLVICASMMGKSNLITDKLIHRRIHANNVTPQNGLHFGKKIYFRLLFLGMIFLALYRVFFGRL